MDCLRVLCDGVLPEPPMMEKLAALGTDAQRIELHWFAEPHPLLDHFADLQTDPLGDSIHAAAERCAEEFISRWKRLPLTVACHRIPLAVAVQQEEAVLRGADLVVKPCRRRHGLEHYLLGHVDWSLMHAVDAPILYLRPRTWNRPPRLLAALDPLREHHQRADMEPAIARAAMESAERLGASLKLVNVFASTPMATILDDELLLNYRKLQEKIEREHRVALERFAQALARRSGVPLCAEVLSGETGEALSACVSRDGIDLVIMGAPRHGALDDLLLGSTTSRLLDEVDVDLLVVPEEALPAQPEVSADAAG